MAKRAKAKAGAKARAPEPPPFYRPFSKIKDPPAAKKTKERGAPAKDEAGDAKKVASRGASQRPPAPKRASLPARDEAPSASSASVDRPAAGPRAGVDAETFARYMAGVRALPDDRAHRIPRTASHVERAATTPLKEDPDAEARARLRSLVIEGMRFETVDDGDRIEGRRLDVDPRELRRLRRAQYAVDGKLDLHGLGIEEARRAVEAFIRKRAQDGDRVVVVVHGKGGHSPRGQAVLRGEIAAWLSQGRAARHVAAFATAPDDHGGSGAVLVLLAR